MNLLTQKIELLIQQTEKWRDYHRANHNPIDAAACAIRLAALKECYELIVKNLKS